MSIKTLLYQIPLSFLSYITPKKKKLVLFGSGGSKQFQGNPKYAFLYLSQQDTDLEFYWSAKNKEQFKILKAQNLPVIYAYSVNGFFKILRAKFLIIEKSSFDVYYSHAIRGRFNFIQTWHGTPFKKVGLDAYDHQSRNLTFRYTRKPLIHNFLVAIKFYSRLKYKVILSSSEQVSKHYLTAFENDKIVNLGFPRNDLFYNKSLLFNEHINRLGLDQYKKVILYAPTFRDNVPEVSPFTDQLSGFNDYLKMNNYILVVKKHPWEKSLKVPSDLSNVRDISSDVDDIQELLPFMDCLITDFSSCAFDFMLTDKPLIFYAYDLQDYLEKCRGLYFDYQDELPGAFAYSENELYERIQSMDQWSQKAEYIEKYNAIRYKYNEHLDGGSSERLLNYLFKK